MKKVNLNFIPQNVAPIGTKQLAIFDSDDNLVSTLPLGGLGYKHQGDKLYSFGALSDVHLPYAAQNASTDFQKALTYFNNVANVDFICISGDMSDKGTDAEWLDYKNHVDTYSPNIPVHLSAGNHDVANGDMLYDYPVQYTGNPLWYSFEQNNDVFIMFGLRQWKDDNVFYNEALQWLYEILEENKDKRCFVFQHEMRLDGCGNAHGLYGWDGLAGRNGQVFLSLMEHYKNVIWFHGHSHTPFRLQSVQPTPIANYDRLHGCHSVHIPSLAIPRYGNSDVIFDAEGYVVDVYENGIHLRGIDFIEEEFVPIASYWIDTTPIEIPVNSYVDTRGVITKKSISLPEGSELYLNQSYSYSESKLLDENGIITVFIPVDEYAGKATTVRIKNSSIPLNVKVDAGTNSVLYLLKPDKTNLGKVLGGIIPDMPSNDVTYSTDYKSVDIRFNMASDCGYILISLRVINSLTAISHDDIKDYIVEVDTQPPEYPEEALKYTNLIPTSVDVNGTIYNSIGYKDYTYISTSNKMPTDTTMEFVTTGLIEIPEDYILYVYGATLDSTESYARVAGYNESKECIQVWANGGGTSVEVSDMGNGIQRIEIVSSTLKGCRYIRFAFKGVGTNLYVYNIPALPQGDITDSVTWTMDKRLSSVGGPDKDDTGSMSSDYILVNPGDVINIYGISSLAAISFYINFYNNESFVSNIPLSNPNVNPADTDWAYAEYNSETTHLTIQTKNINSFNSIRVSCVASTVTVYRNAEIN